MGLEEASIIIIIMPRLLPNIDLRLFETRSRHVLVVGGSSFTKKNLVKVRNCRIEEYLLEKYRSTVLKRPCSGIFTILGAVILIAFFSRYPKIGLSAKAGLQSAVSPFLFRINENFFQHSNLHCHTFPLIS